MRKTLSRWRETLRLRLREWLVPEFSLGVDFNPVGGDSRIILIRYDKRTGEIDVISDERSKDPNYLDLANRARAIQKHRKIHDVDCAWDAPKGYRGFL